MSVAVIYTVKCSICGWWDHRTQGRTRAEAMTAATSIGWSVAAKNQVCTFCADEIPDPRSNP